MPIDKENVKTGHCYAMPTGQLRRVVNIRNGRVIYELRGQDQQWHRPKNAPTIENFGAAVGREVSAD